MHMAMLSAILLFQGVTNVSTSQNRGLTSDMEHRRSVILRSHGLPGMRGGAP